MTAETTLIWTALPAGIRRNGDGGDWVARLSVFLTPRLGVAAADPARLSDYPDFVDWPATLRATGDQVIAFRIALRDGGNDISTTTVTPLAAIDPLTAPHSTAWRSLFPAETSVEPFDPPQEEKTAQVQMMSYSAQGVISKVRGVYAKTLRQGFSAKTATTTQAQSTLREFRIAADTTEDGYTASALGVRRPVGPLQEFVEFHNSLKRSGERLRVASHDDPLEFHRLVGSLTSHPMLLRKLGLVLDFDVPLETLGLSRDHVSPRVCIEPLDAARIAGAHACHWTAVDYREPGGGDFRVFTAAHKTDAGDAGFFSLGGGDEVLQEQLEHATFSLMQFSQESTPEADALPALLQGGMRVTHTDVPERLAAAVRGQSKLEVRLDARRSGARGTMLRQTEEEPPLYAEQLTQGYRIDVRDVDDGAWRSLCRRRGSYAADGWTWPADGVFDDEGSVEPAADAEEDGSKTTLRATNDLFEWNGWSLVLPRPGKPVDVDEPPVAPGNAVTMPIAAQFEVQPGSLPTQRFGRQYQFRARTVDLAGNSHTVEEADTVGGTLPLDGHATKPVRCLRVESAKPPVVVPMQDRGPGEAGDLIVLRDAEDKRYRTERVLFHVLPPAVPLRLAERHGVLDGLDAQASWRMIRDHRGALPDVENSKEMMTPYLPDPLSKQAVLMLPGSDDAIDMPPFDDLPRSAVGRELARSCCLIVCPSDGEVSARVRGRRVTVEVPKGRVQSIRLANRLGPQQLAVCALADGTWLGDARFGSHSHGEASSPALSALTASAERGTAPLLAPSRTLRVVYATQRPLSAPAFGRPQIVPREPGVTTAMLIDDALRLDVPSTGRIDLYASWEDPVDEEGDAGFASRENELYAGGVRVAEDDDKPLYPQVNEAQRSDLVHDFTDTLHHEVSYRAIATSRFVDFFSRSLTDDPANMTLESEAVTLHVPSTAPPDPPDLAYVIPTFKRNNPREESTRPRHEYRTEQRGEGLRIYMNRGWFSSGKGEQLAVVLATPGTPVALRNVASTWGENPLRESAALPGPLELEHLWGGAERIDDWQLDGGVVALVLHDVNFSEEHRLPFADIEFLSQRAYMPMVRLALARYQAHAIDNCKLSRIVHADFVPLAPGRALTVTRAAANAWNLALRGFGFRNGRATSSIVTAQVEFMSRSTPDDAAAWRPLGAPVTLTLAAGRDWQFLWSGRVTIEDERYLGGDWRQRLMVQEFEPFDSRVKGRLPLYDRARLVSAHAVPI